MGKGTTTRFPSGSFLMNVFPSNYFGGIWQVKEKCTSMFAARTFKSASGSAALRRMGPAGRICCVFLFVLFCLCPLLASDQKAIVLVGAGSSVPVPLYRHWADE